MKEAIRALRSVLLSKDTLDICQSSKSVENRLDWFGVASGTILHLVVTEITKEGQRGGQLATPRTYGVKDIC